MKTHFVRLSMILIALVGVSLNAHAQSARERIIERLPVEKNEPLAIIETKVNGQIITLGQKFKANDEWIKSLVFVVKNTSDKRVLFASIDLFFSRPDNSSATFDIFFGPWGLQNRPANPEEQLVGILPRNTAEIGFSDQRFAGFTRFLGDINLITVSEIHIRIGSVIFEDDTMWSRGEYFRRDPSNPSNWNNISR